MASRLSNYLDHHLRIENILRVFWALFWSLNGLDKLFNGTMVDGKLIGWFGVNRDQKFIGYFARLYLPESVALFFLYAFCALEIIVGLVFFYSLLRQSSGAVTRLAFRLSILLFVCFCTGDILFGDRMELWEHGTFMLLALMTYRFYLDRGTERGEVLGTDATAADANKDGIVSTSEFKNYLQEAKEFGERKKKKKP